MECKDCKNELELFSDKEYCEPCLEYLEREKQKDKAIWKANQIAFVSTQLKEYFETSTNNVFIVNKLNETLAKLDELKTIVKSIM